MTKSCICVKCSTPLKSGVNWGAYYARNRRYICADCNRARQREHYHANRSFFLEYMKTVAKTPRARFKKSKRTAAEKGAEWGFTFEEYIEFLKHPCYYCGYELDQSGIGLDRIDNSRGYISGNVHPCCGECNRVRSDRFTAAEMLIVGAAIKQIKDARNKSPGAT
jgi:hypothetical protein